MSGGVERARWSAQACAQAIQMWCLRMIRAVVADVRPSSDAWFGMPAGIRTRRHGTRTVSIDSGICAMAVTNRSFRRCSSAAARDRGRRRRHAVGGELGRVEDAGLRFIVGARIPDIPYQVAEWRRTHPDRADRRRADLHPALGDGTKADPRRRTIFYQYRPTGPVAP